MDRQVSERTMLLLVGAVQFVNVLDFMMVMPLGPDFAKALGIPTSELGIIGGSYTAAAAVGGLLGAQRLDRFDRRTALGMAMLGLVVGTASGALATGLATLVAARVVAGIFGGPATSLSLAIVADVVPPERRGKAMGAVMGSFSVASVLGVPAGLWLAQWGGWRLPFVVVAALGLLLAAGAIWLMPPMRGHLRPAGAPKPPGALRLLSQPAALGALAATLTATMGGFMMVPNLSAYYQLNLGYPRDHMGFLYMAGGAVSFFALRLIGPLVDRFGAAAVAGAGTAAFLLVLFLGFVSPPPAWLPLMALFISFMLCMSMRNVPLTSLSSRVPQPHERASFLSLQSVVQHLAAASGAMLSSRILRELPDGRLDHMPRLALTSAALSSLLPFLLWSVEARLRAAAPAKPAAGAAGGQGRSEPAA